MSLELTKGMRVVVRTDGTVEQLGGKQTLEQVYRNIDCTTVDAVNLRQHGLVMLVDDEGAVKVPPQIVNPTATELYHALCVPGTTWPIRGDVVICPDADFG